MSISVIGISLLHANSRLLHRGMAPIVQWTRHGFYHLKTIIDWMLEPFQAIVGELSNAVRPPAKQAVPVSSTIPRSHTRELLN